MMTPTFDLFPHLYLPREGCGGFAAATPEVAPATRPVTDPRPLPLPPPACFHLWNETWLLPCHSCRRIRWELQRGNALPPPKSLCDPFAPATNTHSHTDTSTQTHTNTCSLRPTPSSTITKVKNKSKSHGKVGPLEQIVPSNLFRPVLKTCERTGSFVPTIGSRSDVSAAFPPSLPPSPGSTESCENSSFFCHLRRHTVTEARASSHSLELSSEVFSG